MNNYLELKKSNCKNCYKCIRHCPVKSIRFSENQANIVEDECILCGKCFLACPQNAKEIRNDVDRAKALLASGAPVYVSLAPAFVANYEGATLSAMENAIKKLGFFKVEETALGATMVKKRYDELLCGGEQDVIITSCCHSVNLLIQKYYPEALPYLAKVLSPMQAHCTQIKAANPTAKTVFIGPCISKKAEAEAYKGIVDCALTFEELSDWLESENIVIEKTPAYRDEIKGRARLFPTSGGILRSMNCENEDYSYITIDGTDRCIEALKDIIAGKIKKCFIEMSACSGSCISGPAMDKQRRAPIRDFAAVDCFSGKTDFDVTAPRLEKNIPFIGTHAQLPGSAAITEILRAMGKTTPEQELNCGSCGYDSCREKAVAVLCGKADLTMCLPYLKERAESFSDKIINNTPNGIVVLNESLEVQQLNAAACAIMNIKNGADILGDNVVCILDPQVFLQVIEEKENVYDKRVYLAEYQKYVDETVIYDKDYRIIMILLRDVTDIETEKLGKEQISQNAIEITDKVIEKQMRIVQEIALLLGETAAETKVALTNLKESLGNE